MTFLGSGTLLWIAVALMLVALVMVLVLVSLPAAPKVPIARRRPDGAGPSTLTKVADAATGSVERLLQTRGSSASTLLERAGVKQPMQNIVVMTGSGMLVGAALGLLLGGLLLALMLVLVVPMLVRLILGQMVSRRESAFADQLDETLQILSGSLRAGYSLPQALSTVALEAEQPTSTEFARIVNETRVGKALELALDDAAARTRNDDFFWVSQAIAINREVGGNLADVLDGVGKTIRERSQLHRQVKALSAEGKLSAIILGAMPFAIMFFISVSNPGYLVPLFTTLAGQAMLAFGAVMMIVGIIWLSKTIKIKY